MQIDFSEAQLLELRRALDLHLHRMETELVNTDDRAYRQDLRRSIEALEGIRRRLDAPFQTMPESSVSS